MTVDLSDVPGELRDAVAAALAAAGVEDGHLAVDLVDAARIRELNREHRGKDEPTDVLSFPIDGDAPPSVGGPPPMLGDVVICPEVAATNAPDHAGSYDDEIALLVVHGLLHLVGMDHAADDERDAMQARERDLLARLYGPLARDPWSG
jgi:probable rRNA maturation factor